MAVLRLRSWLHALRLAAVLVSLTPALTACSTSRTVYQVRPGDDLFGTLTRLRAGDQVLIHAGTYLTPGRYEVRWEGTAAAPIVIRGAPGEARPVIVGTPTQNVFDVSGSQFVLSHIELRGGSHGLRLGDVSHATLAGLVVDGVDDVGISCNLPGSVCDGVTIRDSEIYDTGHDGRGEGIYVGCQSANCVFKNGVIERNVIHDTGRRKGDGIQIKPGSFSNIVRDNVVYRTTFPGITIWGCDDPARELNRVESNSLRMTGGILIIGQAIVHGNRVVGSKRFRAPAARC